MQVNLSLELQWTVNAIPWSKQKMFQIMLILVA